MKKIKYLHLSICWVILIIFSTTVEAKTATITDHTGKSFEISKPFERIISLYPAHTENLFILGQEKKIIGSIKIEDEDWISYEKPVFSYHDDSEKFMAAHPDLVLIRPMIALRYGSFIKKLEQTGITVISLQPVKVEEMYDYWITLGILTGCEEKARNMVNTFKKAVKDIHEKVEKIPPDKRKRVYFEAIHSRMKTFSEYSMAAFVLRSAGGINVASDAVPVRGSNIAAYGKERILSKAEEIDVYLAQQGVMNPVSIEQIMNESGFHVIKAIQNKEVYLIDEIKVSRPTPRLLEGIIDIASRLYPELGIGN